MRQIRAGLVAGSCVPPCYVAGGSRCGNRRCRARPHARDRGAAQEARSERALRLFGEVAAGRLSQRYGLGTEDTRRASLDLNWDVQPSPQWRAVLSDRLDDVHPVESGSRSTLNSLREAFVGWQGEDGRAGVDLGRVNYRNGPAYGFNPTDYFRDGASRAVTTADPLALRENRLGTAMLRVQRLWQGGSATVALAPKLRDGPSRESFSVDLGATNHADRALLAASLQPSDRSACRPSPSTSGTRACNWAPMARCCSATPPSASSNGRADVTPTCSAPRSSPSPSVISRQRAAVGLTYTTPSKLALTAEWRIQRLCARQGAVASRRWPPSASKPWAPTCTTCSSGRTSPRARPSCCISSQRDAGIKNLELTGLVRYNVDDRSRFVWAEARYHWPRFDLALQWQANQGGALTEYGAQTGRTLVQVLAAFYF